MSLFRRACLALRPQVLAALRPNFNMSVRFMSNVKGDGKVYSTPDAQLLAYKRYLNQTVEMNADEVKAELTKLAAELKAENYSEADSKAILKEAEERFRTLGKKSSTPVLNPGGHPLAYNIDTVSILAGRQKEEFEYYLAGLGGFNDQPATGPMGTMKNPVVIYSGFESRIVGCKGGGDLRHRILWFELKEGKKHVCLDCGQVFQLHGKSAFERATGGAAASHAHH